MERDRTADDTMIRYYAVEAMAKLGRKVFGNALLAASEDADEAVRQLAVEALRVEAPAAASSGGTFGSAPWVTSSSTPRPTPVSG